MKTRTSCAAVLGLLLAAALLAGCNSGNIGTPTPATTSVTTDPTNSASHTTAPVVSHPLDASNMVAQPCTALNSSDVSALHIVNALGQANDHGCNWTGDSGGTVGVDWETANTNGLSDLYAKATTMAYWQPTTVAGYPAAYGDSISDQRSQGVCVINTAVSNKLYFFVQFNNPLNPSQSCALAAQAAGNVIQNLGGT